MANRGGDRLPNRDHETMSLWGNRPPCAYQGSGATVFTLDSVLGEEWWVVWDSNPEPIA